jgi:hypothetical protein
MTDSVHMLLAWMMSALRSGGRVLDVQQLCHRYMWRITMHCAHSMQLTRRNVVKKPVPSMLNLTEPTMNGLRSMLNGRPMYNS